MLKRIHTILGVSLMTASGLLAETPVKSPGKSPEAFLQEAQNSQKATIVLLKNKANPGAEAASAIEKLVQPQSSDVRFIAVDMDDPANASFIERYRLSGVPLPLAVVFSHQGSIINAIPGKEITTDSIARSIPSPLENRLIDALSKGRSVAVVTFLPSFSDRVATLAAVQEAQKNMPEELDIIELNLSDKKEDGFAKKLYVPSDRQAMYSVVINKQGMIAGKFHGVPVAKEVEEAAQKVLNGGCAPGGCSSSCK